MADGPVATSLEASVALTPIQRWFFEQRFDWSHHWNQSLMPAPAEVLEPTRLRRQAVEKHVVAHRNCACVLLRARRRRAHGDRPTVRRTAASSASSCYRCRGAAGIVCSCACLPPTQLSEHGPAVQGGMDRSGPGRRAVTARRHHLVDDNGVSWRLIVEDLQTAYRRLGAGSRLSCRQDDFVRAWSGEPLLATPDVTRSRPSCRIGDRWLGE